jgi:hypothetical protein
MACTGSSFLCRKIERKRELEDIFPFTATPFFLSVRDGIITSEKE